MPITIRKADPEDAEILVQLIQELAEFEDLGDQVAADPVRLRQHLADGASPRCEAILAEDENGSATGFALFYSNYSTFLTDWGIYLEDLFVREAYRGLGLGHALLSWLAQEAIRRGAARLDWQVLDWNASAIEFYTRMGAISLQEWKSMRLEGEALASFAGTLNPAINRLNEYSPPHE